MRVLILAGINSNLTAFEAVLKDAKDQWDFIWCLGNVVGYGLEPNECIELLQTLPHLCVMGLQEWTVLGHYDMRICNPIDRHAAEWTQKTLKPERWTFLRKLLTTCVFGNYTILHGSPREVIVEYVSGSFIAALNFPHLDTLYCLTGRLPDPGVYEWVSDDDDSITHRLHFDEPHALNKKRKIIVPGHVGISGGASPEFAEYAILDTESETFERRRCQYNFAQVIQRAKNENFPERYIKRWEAGYLGL